MTSFGSSTYTLTPGSALLNAKVSKQQAFDFGCVHERLVPREPTLNNDLYLTKIS